MGSRFIAESPLKMSIPFLLAASLVVPALSTDLPTPAAPSAALSSSISAASSVVSPVLSPSEILYSSNESIQLLSSPSYFGHNLSDLSDDVVAAESSGDSEDLNLPPTSDPPASSSGCIPSRAANLGVTKALKRPPTNNPLDSHTYIAGIRCRQDGVLNQDFLITDSPGFRQLAARGLEFTLTYYPDLTWSSFGSPAFSSMYIASLDIYTSKAGLPLSNGQIHFTTTGFTGLSYSTPANHSVRAESGGLNDEFRIFELWYGHKFSSELELRLGKIYPWVKFASHQTSGIFSNLIFDYPGVYGTTVATGNFLPYANAPLGMQVIYTPSTRHQFLLNVADGKDDPTGGFDVKLSDISLNGDDGIEILAEYAFLDHSPDPKKLPGYYKIGFQGNTGLFTDFSTSLSSRGNYGGYITLEKMLYAEPDTEIPRSQGLFAFAKLSNVWGNNSIVNFVGSAGLSYAGLIPGRDRDMAGIGFGYSSFNSAASRYYADLFGGKPSSYESILEAVYLAQLTPWLMLIGSYQYIINPSSFGYTGDSSNSGHVILLNTRISF